MAKLPSSKTLTRHAQDIGPDVWHEYKNLREKYKSEGLTPREACERAALEMQLIDRWLDWRSRREVQKLVGSSVPLTSEEMKKVVPEYQPPTATKAESIGEEVMTFAEEVIWARDHRAMVENGSDPPVHFPNKAALSWYQYALASREKFMAIVKEVSRVGADGESIYMQDGQYQYKEIGRQIEEALRETGERFKELEAEFVEMIGEPQ